METLQTLCAELTDFLSMLDEPPHELVVRARAALAADGSAVPEGREPASALRAALERIVELEARYAAQGADVDMTEWDNAIAAASAVLARWGHQPVPPAAGEAVGPEWRPCVKLPITVHVREQRPGETHVSTREGITPVRPDDLIMRGVQGEEYPIGRELFERTYRLGPAEPAPPAAELVDRLRRASDGASAMGWEQDSWLLARAADLLERQAAPVPAPPAEGEVGELVAWLRETGDMIQPSHLAEHQRYKRTAELLAQRYPAPVRLQQLESLAADAVSALRYIEQHHGRLYGVGWDRVFSEAAKLQPAPIPALPEDATVIEPSERTILVPHQAPVPVAERLPGPEDCDAEGRCWWYRPASPVVDRFWHLSCSDPAGPVSPTHWLPTHALPLPAGEVE